MNSGIDLTAKDGVTAMMRGTRLTLATGAMSRTKLKVRLSYSVALVMFDAVTKRGVPQGGKQEPVVHVEALRVGAVSPGLDMGGAEQSWLGDAGHWAAANRYASHGIGREIGCQLGPVAEDQRPHAILNHGDRVELLDLGVIRPVPPVP